MKTAVIGEDADGLRSRPALRLPALRLPALSAETKGKVERPFRYIREDFFLGGTFRNLDDLQRSAP
jgi:hypothetical protein